MSRVRLRWRRRRSSRAPIQRSRSLSTSARADALRRRALLEGERGGDRMAARGDALRVAHPVEVGVRMQRQHAGVGQLPACQLVHRPLADRQVVHRPGPYLLAAARVALGQAAATGPAMHEPVEAVAHRVGHRRAGHASPPGAAAWRVNTLGVPSAPPAGSQYT